MADRFVLSLLARESSSSEPGDKTEGRKMRKLYEWEGSHIVKAEVSKAQAVCWQKFRLKKE